MLGRDFLGRGHLLEVAHGFRVHSRFHACRLLVVAEVGLPIGGYILRRSH